MGAIHEISDDVAIRLNTRAVVTIAARDVVEQCIRGSLAVTDPAPRPRHFPRVGDYWAGQGGINAGIMLHEDGREYCLIVPLRAAGAGAHPRLAWDRAVKHAQDVEIDGHRDFSLMTRREGRLAWVNANGCFDPDQIYWLAAQCASNADCAWAQYASTGGQYGWHKSYEFSVLAVRRVFLP